MLGPVSFASCCLFRSLHRECYVLFRSLPAVSSDHYTGNVRSCFVRFLLSVPLITPGMLCPVSFASCCQFRSLHREWYVLFRSLPAVSSDHYTWNVRSCFVRFLLSVPLISPGMLDPVSFASCCLFRSLHRECYVLFRSLPVVGSAHYTVNVRSCFVRFLLAVPLITPGMLGPVSFASCCLFRSLHRECYVLFRSHPAVCSAHYTVNVRSCFVRFLLAVPLITPGMLDPVSFASCCLFRSFHREC